MLYLLWNMIFIFLRLYTYSLLASRVLYVPRFWVTQRHSDCYVEYVYVCNVNDWVSGEACVSSSTQWLFNVSPENTVQCWFNVGPASQTMAQHETKIGLMSRVCWVGQCRRRGPASNTLLRQHYFVFIAWDRTNARVSRHFWRHTRYCAFFPACFLRWSGEIHPCYPIPPTLLITAQGIIIIPYSNFTSKYLHSRLTASLVLRLSF